MDPIFFSNAEVVRFAIVLFRVAGIMVFAPFFGSHSVPYQVRVVLTLMVTFALAPALPLDRIPPEVSLFSLVGTVTGEVIFGLVLGLAAQFVFAAMQLAGQIIAFQMGFSIINLIDPQSEVEMSVISFLENFIGLILFLLVNGHHWFFLAVSDSFTSLPVTGLRLHGPLVFEVVRLSAQVLSIGVQIAGPVIAVTVLTDIVLGILGRVAPQVNILIVGMPAKLLVGFGCLSLSFYFLPQFLGGQFTALSRELFAIVRKAA
jgi:flagellar biosynthesis protein FliR